MSHLKPEDAVSCLGKKLSSSPFSNTAPQLMVASVSAAKAQGFRKGGLVHIDCRWEDSL